MKKTHRQIATIFIDMAKEGDRKGIERAIRHSQGRTRHMKEMEETATANEGKGKRRIEKRKGETGAGVEKRSKRKGKKRRREKEKNVS